MLAVNNKSTVWSAMGKGLAVGATLGAASHIAVAKILPKKVDAFVKLAEKAGYAKNDMTKELWRNYAKTSKINAKGMLGAAATFALVSAALFAVGHGIKSLFKGGNKESKQA